MVDQRGDRTINEYDGNHNLRFITNAKLEITENVYDSQFRLTDTYDSLRNKGHYEYDTEHHLRYSRVYPDAATTLTAEKKYYPNGLIQAVINRMGTATTTTYDGYGSPRMVQTGMHPAVD